MAGYATTTFCLSVFLFTCTCNGYVIDDTGGLGRRFDGIGGLSGGGVSTRFVFPLFSIDYKRVNKGV